MFVVSVVAWMGVSAPAHALTVNSADCSGIDTTDGNVEDWADVPFLINTEDSVEGTTYYLDSDSGDWTTAEPDNWQYSMNPEQQANIQQMKVCNTDIFLMMLRTEEPMMFMYDKENDTYVDFYSRIDNGDGSETTFTMPADFHYWMVWKMQAADGSGSIMYFAADLEMDAGLDLSQPQENFPALYLFEEAEDVAYEDAAFDPNQDTELTTIEVSNSEENQNVDCGGESPDPSCEIEPVSKKYYAFEVSQDISDLFEFADFQYGDTINMSAAMYSTDTFMGSSDRSTLTVADQTQTKKYTFTGKPITGLTQGDVTSTTAELTWKKMKRTTSYQVRLIDAATDETIRTIKGIQKARATITDLDPDTRYRVIVRARIKKKSGKVALSAWSSSVSWTTESE